jgi:hypothetical protein
VNKYQTDLEVIEFTFFEGKFENSWRDLRDLKPCLVIVVGMFKNQDSLTRRLFLSVLDDVAGLEHGA